MRRQALAHPDAGGGVDDAARLNDAYQVLVSPLSRAQALLDCFEAPAGDVRALPPGFLLQMMELRERLDTAGTNAIALDELTREGEQIRTDATAQLAAALGAARGGRIELKHAQSARESMNVLRAVDRMLEQVAQSRSGGAVHGAQ